MIFVRPGSQVHNLLTVLAVAGEFPMQSLYILGNERMYKALVSRLLARQSFRNTDTGDELTVRMLTVTGKDRAKSIRLYKAALPMLEWIGMYDHYMRTFWNHHFPGDRSHVDRNLRVAEVVAVCLRCGISVTASTIPKLQRVAFIQPNPMPRFYSSKAIKGVCKDEEKKTIFTRVAGMLMLPDLCCPVYNVRGAVMKWAVNGEGKARADIELLSTRNANIQTVDAAVFLGYDYSVITETLAEAEKRYEKYLGFLYRYIYCIPINEDGIRQMTIMAVPDWKNQLLAFLYEPSTRSYGNGVFEYDAMKDGKFYFSWLDGDFARLSRLRLGITGREHQVVVHCYPHQTDFVRDYLGSQVFIYPVPLEAIEQHLGLTGG